MTIEHITAAILGLAVLLAAVRLILWHRASPQPHRPRLIALLLLQSVCAALLFLTLYPPPVPVGGDVIRVATAGAPQLAEPAGAPTLALPEAGDMQGAEHVPDLATALRRHPQVRRITVLGSGFTPRDMDAASGLDVDFNPQPPPAGIVSVTPPPVAAPGESFGVGGMVTPSSNMVVELLDPAGRVTDVTSPDRQGHVRLTGTARAAGNSLFTLRVRTNGRTLAQALVPLTVRDPKPLRLLLLAAAPGPEIKYLRRWATDAGFEVTSQISAGGGISLGDAPISINPATLARFDLVVIDDRSWIALGGRRAALMTAVRNGLGMILRPTGPLNATTRSQWRNLGFALTGTNSISPLVLPKPAPASIARTRLGIATETAPEDMRLPADFIPDVSRLALSPLGMTSAALLQDGGDAPIAAWRAQGLGRVALFTGLDSYALVLTGRATLYDDWWRALARAVIRPAPSPASPPAISWAGERLSLCGTGPRASVQQPDGSAVALQPVGACAAFWPVKAGWHRLITKDGNAPFYVQPADALPAMRSARDRDATLLLPNAPAIASEATRNAPGTAWPFGIAWLLVSALLWWLERSRVGRSQPARSSM